MQLLAQIGPGLPPDVLKKLLAQQRYTGKLPVDALRGLSGGIGRGPTAIPQGGLGGGSNQFRAGAAGPGLGGPGHNPFHGPSGIFALSQGAGISHNPHFGPSPIGPSAPPGQGNPPGDNRAPSQGGDPFSSPYAADQGSPGQIINPAGRGAGFTSNEGTSYRGVTGLSSPLVNPAATPNQNQANLDALARYMMNVKMAARSGSGGGPAFQAV